MANNNENKVLNVPHLRFPEFTDEWKESVLSDFVERVKRKNKNNLCKLPLTISAQYGLVDQISFFNKVIASENMSNYYLLHKGEFAYNKSYSSEYPWGAIKRLDCYEQGTLSSLYICFKPYSHVSSDFLTHYFETSKWHHGISEIAVEGARNHGLLNVGIQDFFETRHCLPQSLLEQEKIAKFLNLIEERIATQNKIIEDLKKLMSAIIHRCYSSQTNMIPLSELLKQCSDRYRSGSDLQVLSVSNKYGFIAQSDQFEDREVASDDTSNYKVVKKGMFAYNPARINVGSIALYEMDSNGIVSPMYVCFTTKSELLPSYLKYYFASQTFKHEMYKRLEGSVRLCLTFEELCNIEIHLPSIEQQKNISKYISKIENNLSLVDSIFSKYQQQRRYLLSQMFI